MINYLTCIKINSYTVSNFKNVHNICKYIFNENK
jgi:hypothetical protein